MKFRCREFRQELDFHLSQRAADLERAGLTPDEARRRAQIELGSAEKYTEQAREESGGAALASLLQDVRYGLRLLRKSPGFTLTAVLLLALGIGANAAIFSVVDWVMLRPIPAVANPGELVYLVATTARGEHRNGFSHADYNAIRLQTGSAFSQVAGVLPFQMAGLAAQGTTSTFWVNYVSGNFFPMLGTHPALGRFIAFDPGQNAAAARELVLSYAFWQARFGGRASVIGEQVTVNGHAATVIGVAPPGFQGATPIIATDGYLPFASEEAGAEGLMLFARRRPGLDLSRIEPALAVAAHRLAARAAHPDRWSGLTALPLTSAPPGASFGDVNPVHLISGLFLILAGLVLLLACANLANLLLARGALRRRELAVRAALGAGRWRLLRQLFIENLLLSLLGGMAGLLVALVACQLLNHLPVSDTVPVVLAVGLNLRVLGYATALALVTGLVVGIVPAWQAARLDPQVALRSDVRTASAARSRLRSALVVAEIAGSLALLIVAGLFTRSLLRAQQVKLGFSPHSVLNVTFDPRAGGDDAARGLQFAQSFWARAQGLPGVESAALAISAPMGEYNYGDHARLPGAATPPEDAPSIGYNAVSPGYFATLKIPLLRGRDLRPGESGVAVVNTKMAQQFWPHADPLGKSFILGVDSPQTLRVIGIAADSVTGSMTDPLGPFAYVPFAMQFHPPLILQLRLRGGDTAAVVRAARAQATAIDPNVPIYGVETMLAAMHGPSGLLFFELGAVLAGIMGLVGLGMALVGVYGVIAYAASQRTHEFGVRMALGAGRGEILRLVLRQGVRMTAAGLAIGLVLAALLARALSGMLFGIRALDPLVFLGSALVLAAVAMAASFLPARRALARDPVAALRSE